MPEFLMPSLGADMASGTLSRWLVKPGDTVKRGQIVAVVETDKAEIEVECFDAGVVEELLVEEGVKVPVGTALARLGAAVPVGAAVAAEVVAPAPAPAPAPVPVPVVTAPAPVVPVEPLAPPPPVVRTRTRIPASPLARRMAAIAGVDLSTLQGSGPGGVVVRRDVVAAQVTKPAAVPAAAAPPPPEPDALQHRLASMREATGALMARSKREIPHYYLSKQVDMTRALQWLQALNATRPVAERLLPAALLLKAVALAAKSAKEMNGHHLEGTYRPAEHVNLAVAVSLKQGGLIAPAILDADTLSLDELMRALLDLVQRARVARLRSSEMSEGTITVTNLGDQGADSVHGVIYAPQVALVGFGRVTEQPVARDGMVGVRPVVTMTLAADHRVSDGHRGSLFLAAVDRLLQEPDKL